MSTVRYVGADDGIERVSMFTEEMRESFTEVKVLAKTRDGYEVELRLNPATFDVLRWVEHFDGEGVVRRASKLHIDRVVADPIQDKFSTIVVRQPVPRSGW